MQVKWTKTRSPKTFDISYRDNLVSARIGSNVTPANITYTARMNEKQDHHRTFFRSTLVKKHVQNNPDISFQEEEKT